MIGWGNRLEMTSSTLYLRISGFLQSQLSRNRPCAVWDACFYRAQCIHTCHRHIRHAITDDRSAVNLHIIHIPCAVHHIRRMFSVFVRDSDSVTACDGCYGDCRGDSVSTRVTLCALNTLRTCRTSVTFITLVTFFALQSSLALFSFGTSVSFITLITLCTCRSSRDSKSKATICV